MEVLSSLYNDVVETNRSLLPVDIFNSLNIRTHNEVTITSSALSEVPQKYLGRVEFKRKRSFVATHSSPEVATEKAANLADLFFKRSINIESKTEKGSFSQGQLTHLYDADVLHIVAFLKAFGYELETEDRACVKGETFEVIHLYTIAFGGFGKFSGISTNSRNDACKEAIAKLKKRFEESFPKSKVASLFGDDSSAITTTQQQDSYTGHLLRAIKDWNHQLLHPVDYIWVDVLKTFRKVYHPAMTPTDVMHHLLEAGKVRMSIRRISYRNSIGKASSQYKSCLYLANLSLVSIELTEAKSIERSLSKGFSFLRQLNKVFNTLKQIKSSELQPFEIMDNLTSRNMEEVKVKFTNLANFTVETFVEVGCLLSFATIGYTQNESMTDAFISAGTILQSYADLLFYDEPETEAITDDRNGDISQIYIQEAPLAQYQKLSNDALSKAYEPLFSLREREPYLPYTTKDIKKAASSLRKLVGLINRFNKVYDASMSPDEVIESLMEIDRAQFVLTSNFDERKQLHITKLKSLDLGTFHGAASEEAKSRMNAIVQVFDILVKFSRIFSTYMSLRSPTTPPSSYMHLFVSLNSELVKLRTVPRSSNVYITSLKIKPLHIRFEELGNNIQESEGAVFKLLVELLELLTAGLDNQVSTINQPYHRQLPLSLERSLCRRPVPIRASHTAATLPQGMGDVSYRTVMKFILKMMAIRGKYDDGKSEIEIINELIRLNPRQFIFVTKRTWDCRDGKTVKRYKTEVTIENVCCFTTVQFRKRNSKDCALRMIYDRLSQLTNLVKDILESSFDYFNVDFIDRFCMNHEEILTIIIGPDSFGKTLATFRVTNLGEYQGVGADRDQAKVKAFRFMAETIVNLEKDAQKEAHEEEAQLQANLNRNIALATQAESPAIVDASLALRIKLIRTFTEVYNEERSASAFWDDFSLKLGPSLATIKTAQCRDDDAYTTVIDLVNVCNFYDFNGDYLISRELCIIKVIRLFKYLTKLVQDFQEIYPSSSPSQVIEMLQDKKCQVLHVIKSERENLPEQHRFVTTIELDQLRTFSRAAADEKQSFDEVSDCAVDYLLKLTCGLNGC